MKKSHLTLSILILLIVSLIIGCAPTKSNEDKPGGTDPVQTGDAVEPDQEVIKIAVYAPMTGDHAEYGISYRIAAEIQADLWNERGGAGGYKVEVVHYDDKNSGEESATIAERLVEDKDVVGTIGSYISGVTMTATPIFQENGLVTIAPSSSHPDFSSEGDYIFRNNALISQEAAGTIQAVEEVLDVKRVGLLYIQTDWGIATADAVKILLEDHPYLELAMVQECLDGSDDYSVQIANFRNEEVEAVIVGGLHNTFVPFARQYRQIDPDIGLAAFANLYNEKVIELGGEFVEGTAIPVSYFNESNDPKVVAFREEFEKRMGSFPSQLAAQAYDSAGILLEAIDQVKSKDRAAIREAVQNISYDGVGGLIEFNEIGDAMKQFISLEIIDGKFTMVD